MNNQDVIDFPSCYGFFCYYDFIIRINNIKLAQSIHKIFLFICVSKFYNLSVRVLVVNICFIFKFPNNMRLGFVEILGYIFQYLNFFSWLF